MPATMPHQRPSSPGPECCFGQHFRAYLKEATRTPEDSSNWCSDAPTDRRTDSVVIGWPAVFHSADDERRSARDHCHSEHSADYRKTTGRFLRTASLSPASASLDWKTAAFPQLRLNSKRAA